METIVVLRSISALYGLFIGDSLAMPVHWFYNVKDIYETFPPNGIKKFEDAPKYHPSSIMNLHSTSNGGRKNVNNNNKNKEIIGDMILKGRRKYWGIPNQHYHRDMKAGENTLNAQCVRVLMKSIINNNYEYNKDIFLNEYINFMTSDPPLYNDTYAESYHRGFFANLEKGLPKDKCGAITHDTPSIGGLVSIGPLTISLLLKEYSINNNKEDFYQNNKELRAKIQSIVRTHLFLTHPDDDLAKVCVDYVDLIASLLFRQPLLYVNNNTATTDEKDNKYEIEEAKIILQQIANKIIGTTTLNRFLKSKYDTDVVGGAYSPACYISGSWPAILYFAIKYIDDPIKGLLANCNVGGDNVHRGAVLGFIFGLIHSKYQLQPIFNKLIESIQIDQEIHQYIDICLADQ